MKKTRTPAIILAVIDTSVGLFVGFIFASYLGWPLIDSIFLAGVVAMSSTSIAMKVLFDLKRMSSPEVEFLIGLVVVETFIAMIILSVASGMIVQPVGNPIGYGQLILGICAFYAFFVWMAMWAVPRVVKFFNSIENDELFILFALGIVFLTSGFAAVMNVPPIIGAFFIGMILAESQVTIRIQSKLESFKDAFVAIFSRPDRTGFTTTQVRKVTSPCQRIAQNRKVNIECQASCGNCSKSTCPSQRKHLDPAFPGCRSEM